MLIELGASAVVVLSEDLTEGGLESIPEVQYNFIPIRMNPQSASTLEE